MSQTTKNVFLSDEQWNSIVDSADTELEEYEIEGVAISKDSFDSYCELENKYNFVKQILAASPVNNSYLLEVKKSIDEDFYKLCEIENKINNVKSYNILLNMYSELKKIAVCPELYKKSIGAIGGAFSSGKSSFVNSLFIKSADKENNIKLPVGINPVTAIPTYVMSGTTLTVNAITPHGTCTVDRKLFSKIQHTLINSLGFNIKNILEFCTVKCQLDSEIFKNVCLIDTPGYDAADTGETRTDKQVAYEHIKNCDFLIWLIPISQGTITDRDIAFLQDLPFGREKDLYVVLTQADKEPESRMKTITDEIITQLNENSISFKGLCVYSSTLKHVYMTIGQELFDFIKNRPVGERISTDFKQAVEKAFAPFTEEITKSSRLAANKVNSLKKVKLELQSYLETDSPEDSIALADLDGLIKSFLPDSKTSERLNRVTEARSKIFNSVSEFCSNLGFKDLNDTKYCINCGNKIPKVADVCSFCKSIQN